MSNAFLPDPFEWITVPAGKVTLEGAMFGYIRKPKTFDVAGFKIAKYPITNAQYAQFIAAGGYSQRQWWVKSAWQYKEKGDWKVPYGWTGAFKTAAQPVFGVSWFESVAYCLWLGTMTNSPIMLPTEQQWQHAAQVVELTGNIQEWCLTNFTYGTQQIRQYNVAMDDYDDDTYDPVLQSNKFVLRGGPSFTGHIDSELATLRRWDAPYARKYNRGFRVMCLLPQGQF